MGTNPLDGGIRINGTDGSTCATGNWYTVQDADTCDSIALANHISSGSLYEINPTLYNCDNPGVGLQLCLPLACETIYEVQPTDNCTSIASKNSISWLDIISYNGMIDDYCSNVVGAKPSFGRILCVSPPGGYFNSTPGNGTGGGVGGPGGSGDGYADYHVDPPEGAKLAPGTTTACGGFYTARDGDSCRTIVINANTPMGLFLAANPSLTSAETCDSELSAGLTYCVHPTRNWNQTIPTPTTSSTTIPPTSSSVSSTTTPVPSATPTKVPSPNGLCGTEYTCLGSGFGDCCSTWGYCGSTSDYCAPGLCDPSAGRCDEGNPISQDGLCGSNSPVNATCAGSSFGPCCSSSGYCGSTVEYCASGRCQPEFGTCSSGPPVSRMAYVAPIPPMVLLVLAVSLVTVARPMGIVEEQLIIVLLETVSHNLVCARSFQGRTKYHVLLSRLPKLVPGAKIGIRDYLYGVI